MGTLVFQATLGGSVNLIGPNTASTINFTLPSADGSSGQALTTNGSGTLSFATVTTGAAGSTTQVQYNSSGAFAGSANLTFNGTTLTAANTSITTSETLSYGTANGVTYLNGSKVLTSGSALTFDGTNLTNALGGSYYAANSNYGVGTPDSAGLQIFTASGDSIRLGTRATGTFTELARFNATGLGIGTSSPAQKLDVAGQIRGVDRYYFKRASDNYSLSFVARWDGSTGSPLTGTAGIYTVLGSEEASSGVIFAPSNTERMRLDSAGNLGLGVTPSAWSAYKGLQITGGASFVSYATAAEIWANGYYNGTNSLYVSNGYASRYQQTSGQHVWFTAASGTAGNAITFTQAMTLDASGNLGVGNTSPAARIDAFRSTVGTYFLGGGGDNVARQLAITSSTTTNSGDTHTFNAQSGTGIIAFATTGTERARIDSSGNLLVGTTTVVNPNPGISITPGSGSQMAIGHGNGQASGTYYAYFVYNGTVIGSITQSGTTAVLYNVTSDQRLKENIVDAPEFGSVIDSIQVRSYDWKADGTHQRAGFVAQELVTVAPEAVHQPADTEEMMAVDYSKLVPMLVKEIQSLRQRVAQLETN